MESTMANTRIGLIGAGYWGPNLARNFAQMEDAELVAIADLDEERLRSMKSRHPGVVTTRVYRDLFSLDLDAVVIATPPITHYTFARECLEQGLNVLVEKPLVLRSRHGEKLVRLARDKNLVLMVGHTFEYNPAVRAIKEIIDSGELGQIYYLDAVRVNLGLFQPNINAMWDLAPHDVSIILYLLNQTPLSVSCEGGAFVLQKRGIHDIVYMHMKFPDGVLANIRLSWLDPNKTRRITVVGSDKMLIYDDVEPSKKIRIFDKGVETFPYSDSYEFHCSYRYGDITIPHIEWVEPLQLECEHFVDCIKNDCIPQSDGESGVRVVRVLEAAEKSLKSGNGGQIPISQENFVRKVAAAVGG